MSCKEAEVLLFADRTSEQESALQDHARSCQSCAQLLKAEQSLLTALRQEAGETRNLAPSAETDLRVLEAFRRRTPPRRWAPLPEMRWPVAVAAGILLAILVAVSSDRELGGLLPYAGLERSGQSESDVAVGPVDGLGPEPTTRADRGTTIDATSWPAEADLATDFFALTSCPELRCLEGAQHVRISLPRSSMSYFGLPVSSPGGSDRIDADVLVGVDGVARAIRFVRPVSLEVE